MGLSCFPEFNQSITLSILCYLPPELPPYHLGKLGNKTSVPLQNIVAEIVGWGFISPKVGSREGFFQSFLAENSGRNLDNCLLFFKNNRTGHHR
jgi:hypothetical protein